MNKIELKEFLDEKVSLYNRPEFIHDDPISIPHKFNKKEENYTAGVGLNIKVGSYKLKIDYGYANFDHLSDPKRFSIGLTL